MKTKRCSDRYRKMAERMWPIIKANYEVAPPWGKRPDSIDLITAALRRVAKSEFNRGWDMGYCAKIPRPLPMTSNRMKRAEKNLQKMKAMGREPDTKPDWTENCDRGGEMSNKHIPTEEIRQDILDTEREIERITVEAQHLENTPLTMPSARFDHIKAAVRRAGIVERHVFIGRLREILAAREAQSENRGGA